ILVGVQTVEDDNPQLTTRLENKSDSHHPVKIILDSSLRISPNANVIIDKTSPTWLATTKSDSNFGLQNIKILRCKETESMVDLDDLLKQLAGENITSLLVEGGPRVVTSFLKAGLVDRVIQFVSPSYLGGEGRGAVGSLGIERLSEKISLKNITVKTLGSDLMIEGDVDV
ncbi:RibD family protein, partial [Bdellovibrionota bacterium]